MKVYFPLVAKDNEGSNPCEKQTFEFDVGFGRSGDIWLLLKPSLIFLKFTFPSKCK